MGEVISNDRTRRISARGTIRRVLDFRRIAACPGRLPDPRAVFRLRFVHRVDRKTQGYDQLGFSDLGPLRSGLDHQPGIHRRESGRAGSDRHVRVGRQVRHHDRAFLLDRRGAGHAVRRRFHDAVLLRQPRAQRAGISEAAIRREDAGVERDHVRRDDGVFVRNFDVRAGLLFELVLRWSFTASVLLLGGDRPGLHFFGRADERNLQRSAAIFPDRAGVCAAGDLRR